MKVGIIGAGHIGGGIARQLAGAGHEVLLSFSRDPQSLAVLATEIGPSATTGSPAEAAGFGEVVVISVPWSMLPQALEHDLALDFFLEAGIGRKSGAGRIADNQSR